VSRDRPPGSVAEAVTADLDGLFTLTPHPVADALRALALRLATAVDGCPDHLLGELASELRSTLIVATAYVPLPVPGRDDDGDDIYTDN
jgi:hypothetical protein